jgi:hypothetical protein
MPSREAASGTTCTRVGSTSVFDRRSSAVFLDGVRIASARRTVARRPWRNIVRHVRLNAAGNSSKARS